jgi:hypothetical protein
MDATTPNDFIDIEKWGETHPTTTVRKLIGDPSFKAIAEIPGDELEGEINKILDYLAEFRIDVEMDGISPEEGYRFLTTEIMDSDIVDPPAPKWWNFFCYYLYHPDAEEGSTDETPRLERDRNTGSYKTVG